MFLRDGGSQKITPNGGGSSQIIFFYSSKRGTKPKKIGQVRSFHKLMNKTFILVKRYSFFNI